MKHYQGGCINCGTRRVDDNILTGKYDIFLVVPGGEGDNWAGNKRICVGLCESCYEVRSDLNKNDLAFKLYESEAELSRAKIGDDSRAHEFKYLKDRITDIEDRITI